MCRYNWHSAGLPGLAIFSDKNMNAFFKQKKYTEAILSNSTRKLLWREITKMLIAVFKNKFIVLFIIIFGTLSFPICRPTPAVGVVATMYCVLQACHWSAGAAS